MLLLIDCRITTLCQLHKNNIEAMQKASHASLFHVASSSTNIWHDHCPKGVNSWCRYQQDLVTGKSTYKSGAGLDQRTKTYIQ